MRLIKVGKGNEGKQNMEMRQKKNNTDRKKKEEGEGKNSARKRGGNERGNYCKEEKEII